MSDTEDKQQIKTQHKKQKPSKRKPLRLAALLVFGLFISVATFSVLVHFTSLKHTSKIDPIDTIMRRIKGSAYYIEQAHFHIAESERLVAEVRQNPDPVGGHGHGDSVHTQTYERMIWHNDEATKYMLAAEAHGADLRKEGLIKRLCDTLGDQYALMSGIDVDDIPEEDKLNTRVVQGEELQTVFAQIQEQLRLAMSW